jgi:hypothetical protein
MFVLFVVVAVLASFVQSGKIIPPEEYFATFDEGEPRIPYQWFLHSFKFLVDNKAFYKDRVHFMVADSDYYDVASAVSTVRALGWNASYENVLVLEAQSSWFSNYNSGKYVCKILRTNATNDDSRNYREVINMRSDPYTVHDMYATRTDCEHTFICPWIKCDKKDWVLSVIKIDTRGL